MDFGIRSLAVFNLKKITTGMSQKAVKNKATGISSLSKQYSKSDKFDLSPWVHKIHIFLANGIYRPTTVSRTSISLEHWTSLFRRLVVYQADKHSW